MDEYKSCELVLQLFNLEDEDIQSIEYVNENGNSVVIVFLADNNRQPCPRCGCTRLEVKEYVQKDINHAILSDRKCTLRYFARRYKCQHCGRTFYEHNPFCFKGQKLSALTVMNILRDLKNQSETFSSVAHRYYVSPTTVASIFDTHVDLKRYTLPEYMSWDECYAFHHKDYKSKYVCMFLDYQRGSPIDILPSRRSDFLIDYLYKIPKEERDRVKMVSTDMWNAYRTVIHTMLPKALISVDHFHLSKEFYSKMDAVRLQIQNYYKRTNKDGPEYYLLKNFNWFLWKHDDARDSHGELIFDPNRERKLNKKFNRYLNYYELQEMLIAIDPRLSELWYHKEQLIELYEKNTIDTAPGELKKLIKEFKASEIPEVRAFASTLDNWKTEIINSFTIIFTDYIVDKDTGQVELSERKLNNGLMENRNSILKIIKKNANGYNNWERFRNRCLYVLRKEATASLYPIKKKKGGSTNG